MQSDRGSTLIELIVVMVTAALGMAELRAHEENARSLASSIAQIKGGMGQPGATGWYPLAAKSSNQGVHEVACSHRPWMKTTGVAFMPVILPDFGVVAVTNVVGLAEPSVQCGLPGPGWVELKVPLPGLGVQGPPSTNDADTREAGR